MAKSRTYRKTRSARSVLLRRILDFLILVVVLWLAYTLAGRSLRQVAIAQVAGLTNAQVKAESIDFNFDGSVSIEKLAIRPVQARPYDNAILRAEKVYARFDIGSLLLVRPRLREITIDNFVFNAQCDLDAGVWNTSGLKINVPEGGTGQLPVVRLKGGILQYSKVSQADVTIVTEVPVDASFEPSEEAAAAYTFVITTADAAHAGKSILNGTWRPGSITITGGISSADVPSLERAWEIKTLAAKLSYDADNSYSLQLKIKDLLSSDAYRSDTLVLNGPSPVKSWSVIDIMQRFFARFSPAGHIDLDLAASGNLKRPGESELNGKVYCKDVSIRDVNFPYPVQHIAGEVDFTEQGLTLNDLSGEHNDVDLTFGGWSRDFGRDWQYEFRIKSDNMALDEDLYESLKPKQKKLWSAFSLSGLAAIDYTFSRQPRTVEQKSLKVRLFDSEVTYEKFPYPLENLAGNLLFEADDIHVSDLVSRYNGREIALNGRVAGLSADRPIYDVSVSAKDVPLDSELAAAMPPKQRNFYEQLDMTGLADAEVKVFTPEANSGPTAFTADVSIKETSLKLEQLPLDINEISAKAVVTGDSIDIQDFTGRYDDAAVSLTGRVWPTEKAEQKRYYLKLHAEQMQLNDNLIGLLPASLKEFFSDRQLKGKVNISADLNKDAPDDCSDYKLVVDCLGNSLDFHFAQAAPNQVSIGFKPAPYPLKDVTGKLVITADNIKLENITAAAESTASENETTIKLNGDITLADNAFNSGRFVCSANDIAFEERLSAALPADLRDTYVKLAPSGRFDLNLEDIKMYGTGEGKRRVDFDGNAKLKNCDLDILPAVTEINAVLDINGVYNTGGGFSQGRVAALMEGFKVDGKSITALKAELNYDRSRRSWAADSFAGDCYGGKLTGKFEFNKPTEGPSEYQLQAGFDNIDLKQFLSEPNSNEAHLASLSERADYSQDTRQELQIDDATSGKMSGSLSIRAGFGSGTSRLGTCKLIITDMYVGKPSPIAKLLYVLKLTDSKDFVFKQMFVDSYIKNDSLVFEKFDLSGESLAFNGEGLMDLKTRDVELTLTVRGKRLADAEPSVLQSLAEDIGGYVVRMDVTGNAYDPDVKIKTLPVIKDSLNILGKKTAKAD